MPLFIAAGIAAAGSIGGALIGSSSAGSAASAQQQAANTATAEQSREFNQTQTNLQPWLQTGTGALSQLAGLYGIAPTAPANFSATGANPTLAQTNPVAGNNVGAAAPGSPGATGPSNVNPNATFYQSPDYQFQLQQGIGGVDAGAAARGYLDSGATRKAEIGYAGNLASSSYNNYANRLAGLAGVGQTTASNLGQLGSQYASNVGNIAVNQGNNRASSYLAQGQNYGNTVNNLAGIGSGLIRNGAFGSGGATPTSPGYVDWGF